MRHLCVAWTKMFRTRRRRSCKMMVKLSSFMKKKWLDPHSNSMMKLQIYMALKPCSSPSSVHVHRQPRIRGGILWRSEEICSCLASRTSNLTNYVLAHPMQRMLVLAATQHRMKSLLVLSQLCSSSSSIEELWWIRIVAIRIISSRRHLVSWQQLLRQDLSQKMVHVVLNLMVWSREVKPLSVKRDHLSRMCRNIVHKPRPSLV